MEIALIIKPTETLPPEKFQAIRAKADALGITPEEFVITAIEDKLNNSREEAA